MSGLISALDVSAMALQAQSTRMATISSNLANIDSVSSTEDGAFKALLPEFETLDLQRNKGEAVGVRVTEIKESKAPARAVYNPSHPQANTDGYIFLSNVSREEMIADMTNASESYKASLAAMGVANTLIDQTLRSME